MTDMVLLGWNSWAHWSRKEFDNVSAISNYWSSSRQHCCRPHWHFSDGTLPTEVENCYITSGKHHSYYSNYYHFWFSSRLLPWLKKLPKATFVAETSLILGKYFGCFSIVLVLIGNS